MPDLLYHSRHEWSVGDFSRSGIWCRSAAPLRSVLKSRSRHQHSDLRASLFYPPLYQTDIGGTWTRPGGHKVRSVVYFNQPACCLLLGHVRPDEALLELHEDYIGTNDCHSRRLFFAYLLVQLIRHTERFGHNWNWSGQINHFFIRIFRDFGLCPPCP